MLNVGANGALNIGIDVQTLQVRAICVTTKDVSDAAVVSQLLEQLSASQPLLSFTGDGAYVRDLILDGGAGIVERGCMSTSVCLERSLYGLGLRESSSMYPSTYELRKFG